MLDSVVGERVALGVAGEQFERRIAVVSNGALQGPRGVNSRAGCSHAPGTSSTPLLWRARGLGTVAARHAGSDRAFAVLMRCSGGRAASHNVHAAGRRTRHVARTLLSTLVCLLVMHDRPSLGAVVLASPQVVACIRGRQSYAPPQGAALVAEGALAMPQTGSDVPQVSICSAVERLALESSLG